MAQHPWGDGGSLVFGAPITYNIKVPSVTWSVNCIHHCRRGKQRHSEGGTFVAVAVGVNIHVCDDETLYVSRDHKLDLIVVIQLQLYTYTLYADMS